MQTELHKPKVELTRIIAWMTVCFLILPIFVVVPVSFTSKRYLSWPGSEWSLRHYEVLVGEGGWLASIGDSFIVATSAAVLAIIFGTLFAVGHWRLNNRVTRNLRLLMLQPKGAPGGVKAWDFAAAAQDPQSQVEVFQQLGTGPINPAAAALVPKHLRHRDAGNPDNLAVQIPADADWYASDYGNILNRYLDAIAS